MSLSVVLSGLLVEAATTNAVDVLTKRTVDPKIRLAGKSWKALSLAEKVLDFHGAIRIAVYSDAAGIIAGEIVVQKTSGSVLSSLPEIDVLNYQLIEKAEGLIAAPDFENHIIQDPSALDPMRGNNTDFMSRDWESYGGALFDLVETCLEGAIASKKSACDLLSHDEVNVPRRRPVFGWEPSWVDRINTGLGYALWVPVPIIGVGHGYSPYGEYNGTFWRNTAEGYGRLFLSDGAVYLGQIRSGRPHGYGVKEYPDGRIFAGYNNPFDDDLGVVLTTDREKAVIGASYRGNSKGFGRQVGLNNGVGSVSGFWSDDGLSLEVPTQGSVHRRLYENYKSSDLGNVIGDKYHKFVDDLRARGELHGGAEDEIDARFLGLIRQL